ATVAARSHNEARMSARVVRAAAFVVSGFGAILSQSISPLADTAVAGQTLTSDAPVERTIAGGDSHRFELALPAGQYVSVSVTQRGVDVVAQTIGPDGTLLGRFDDEARDARDEHVQLVAGTSGTYVLVISPAFARAATGTYSIRVVERRDATDDDRSHQVVRAERAEYFPLLERYQNRAARPLIERALATAEQSFGPDDFHVAEIRRDLAKAL